MGVQKTVKEAKALLGPEGFVFEGVNGSKHLVFRHTDTGVVARVSGRGFERSKGKALKQAKQAVSQAESTTQQFLRFAFQMAGVRPHDEKIVKFHLSRLAQNFRETHPDVEMSRTLPYMALKHSPLVELVEPAPRGGDTENAISTWKLTGALFGVTEVEPELIDVEPEPEPEFTDQDDEGTTEDAAGVADRQRAAAAAAGDGLRDDRPGTGTDGAGGAGEPDVERDVPTPERGAAPGGAGLNLRPGLPASLMDELREALSGDLRAENELLRSQLHAISQNAEHAMGVLRDITSNVEEALSLNGTEPQPRHPLHADIPDLSVPGQKGIVGQQIKTVRHLGPKVLRRLRWMEEYRTELPDLMMANDLHEFLERHGESITASAAGATLWTLHQLGYLRREAYGVYGWA